MYGEIVNILLVGSL